MMVLLEAVVQHGTGAAAAQMKHALGGKTGTTNNYTDAWFVGFSPSVTCGTWVGYDDRRSLGEKETGARAALPIWMDFMKVAIADAPNEQFSKANAPTRKLEVEVTPADQDQGATPAAAPDTSVGGGDVQSEPQTATAQSATPVAPPSASPGDQVAPGSPQPATKRPVGEAPAAVTQPPKQTPASGTAPQVN
jgi:penicillin-binding protein 1A